MRQREKWDCLIKEIFESILTPVTREARKLGYLYESIALNERHRRRQQDWQSHINKCKEHTLRAVSSLPKKQNMLVLGSGPLIELPIDDLVALFDKVYLFDFVHPRAVRAKWGRHPKVELVEIDLLGLATNLLQWTSGTLPVPRPPDLRSFHPSFVLSANCLSQLPLSPRRHLERYVPEVDLNLYCEQISAAHLISIKAAAVPHLIMSDFETRTIETDGTVGGTTVPFFDRESLKLIDSWTWKLAPKGELYRNRSVEMSVGAFTLL